MPPVASNGKEMLENNNKIGLNISLGWERSWSSSISSISNPIHMYHHHPFSPFQALVSGWGRRSDVFCWGQKEKYDVGFPCLNLKLVSACFCLGAEILMELTNLEISYKICSLVVVKLSTTYDTFWTKYRMNELEETSKGTLFFLVMHS